MTVQTVPTGACALPEGSALPGFDRMTVVDLVEAYVDDRRRAGEISEPTADTFRWRLKSLVNVAGPGSPPEVLDRAMIRRWQHSVGTQSPASRRAYLSTVKRFCRWAVAEGHLVVDPSVDAARVREPRRVPRALAARRVAQLLAYCHDDLRNTAIVWLMVGCGLRCVEVERLDVDDYDPAGLLLHVRGKADNERVLPVPGMVAEALNAYLDEASWTAGALIRTGPATRRPDGAPHCANPVCRRRVPMLREKWQRYCVPCRKWREGHGGHDRPLDQIVGHRIDRHTMSLMMVRLMYAAGVKTAPGDGVSAHALRHTFGSDALDRCHDVRVVQELLGHVSILSTQIYLRRANLDQMRAAMSDGSDYLNPGA